VLVVNVAVPDESVVSDARVAPDESVRVTGLKIKLSGEVTVTVKVTG
jgi:hypothetical protein